MTFFSIILGTYGDEWWKDEAEKLAIDTINSQGEDCEVVRYHGETLAEARNHAARDANGDFLIFLDTGDALDPGYVTAMRAAKGDIRRPAVRGFTRDGFIEDAPVLTPPPKSLFDRNYIVIGAAVRREMFFQVDGFSELPVLEDWDLWLKIVSFCDARVEDVPDAVYLINDSHDRNKHPDIDQVARGIRRRFQRWKAKL